MSRGLLIIVALVLIFSFFGCSTYNGMVQKDTNVQEKWANVQTQYQRRADLIPNLVRTVQGVANFEKSTLQSVIEARANATSIRLNADQLTPENVARFQQAQEQLGGSLSRLLAVAENYPQLRATQNFSELQAQLEGTENRIAVARNDFNTAVRDYNQSVRTFPNNIFAGMFGFNVRGFFEASAAAQQAPTVQF
ncbi:LemA family protein [Nibrella viscosa]|uniref:LemA family protein n=1 Tax=Nibrella viscosa TaxID=1084524 RepID=A0ABP8KI40_9BACT